MATEAEPELSQAEVEAAVGLELLARTFPREMAMYRTHGCEHPYAEEGLDGALRLLSHDYCRLIEEILTEGNVYHDWPKALSIVGNNINAPLREFAGATVALQRRAPGAPASLTIRYRDRLLPGLGEQVFRRAVERGDRVQLMARARVTLQAANVDPASGAGAGWHGLRGFRWCVQMEDEEGARRLFEVWSGLIAERGEERTREPAGEKRKREVEVEDEDEDADGSGIEGGGEEQAEEKECRTELEEVHTGGRAADDEDTEMPLQVADKAEVIELRGSSETAAERRVADEYMELGLV